MRHTSYPLALAIGLILTVLAEEKPKPASRLKAIQKEAAKDGR